VPLLVSHGVLGCHVDTVDSWWADLPGPGFRVIGPSPFGYFGSTLPEGATPADQADAYALLVDHLGIERAVVIGFSAGSGSILELARRHPERVTGLILACCRLGGGITTPKAFAPVFRLAYSVDRLFWNFKKPIGEGRPQSHRRLLRQAPEVLKAEGVLTLVVRQPAQRLLSPDHRARWSPSERARRLLCRMCSGERVEVAAGGWFLSLRARAPRWPERR